MCWRREVPELDTEDWENIWDYPMQQLVSARDRLIQFKILHRVHFTPQKLHRIFPLHPFKCWCCTEHPATFIHVFWECPVIQLLLADVSKCICSVTTASMPLSIDVCILGLVHLLVMSRAMKTLLGLLLFYAHKSKLTWKSPQDPIFDIWKSIISWCHSINILMGLGDVPINSPRFGTFRLNLRRG